MKDLKSELGGNLEEVTLAMMEPCELFDAKSLRKAMKVSMCVVCNSSLNFVNNIFSRLFNVFMLSPICEFDCFIIRGYSPYRVLVLMRLFLLKCCVPELMM